MSINLSVISMNENKVLFTDNVLVEEEICLEIFSFKVIAGKKIILSENNKKIIVYFNEIFILNYFEYIIIYKENLVNLITYFPDSCKNFEYLIQSNFVCLLFNFLKKIILFSNFICFQKVFLYIILFAFVFSKNTLSQDKHLDQEEFLIQKNIYLVLNKISTEAKPEIPPVTFTNAKASPLRGKSVKFSKISMDSAVAPMGTQRDDRKNKKLEVIDSEIQYFMQLKNK